MVAEEILDTRDVGDERREFLEHRASGIGATDSPKILGLSRWGTALTVYHEKVGDVADSPMSLPAWLGLKMQATVAELYSASTEIRVRADNRHHRHKTYDWLVCHLDYRAWGHPDVVVECKTKAHMTGWGPEGTTEIPADVWVQVQHEMAVTAAEGAHVAVLFGHHTFRVYKIPRDDQFIAKMIPRLESFWYGNVIARVPPVPTGHALDSDQVKRDNPDHDDSLKPATPEQEALIRKLVLARANLKQIRLANDEVENQIKQLIGDAAGIRGSFGQITWKKDRDRQVVDWENVAIIFGNVVEELLLVANPGDDSATVARLARAQAVYDTAVGLNTATKTGARRFLVNLTEEA